jgi:hypothetical protein
MLIFNDLCDLLVSLFMCVDKVNNYVVCLRQISKNHVLKEVSETWNMRELSQEA